jgi:hypothetical protein
MTIDRKPTTFPISPQYRPAIWIALAIQIPLTLLLSLMLDGGRVAKIGGAALIAFWIGTTLIILRRPKNPRPLDLLFIRWSYPLLLLAAMAIADLLHLS